MLRGVAPAALLALDLRSHFAPTPIGRVGERRDEQLERLLEALDDHLGAAVLHLLVGLELDLADLAARRDVEVRR